MRAEVKRNWTQDDLVEETRRRYAEDATCGFFNLLNNVTEEVFGGLYEGTPRWQFDMGALTIGDLLDFKGGLSIIWHNQSGGPSAYVGTNDYEAAEAFRNRFGMKWLDSREARDREDEDGLRAGGWRP